MKSASRAANSVIDGVSSEYGTASNKTRSAARSAVALALAGLVAFGIAAGIYIWYALTHPMPDWMEPVDLRVYRFGGFIAAHVSPWYQAHRSSPLYDWPGFHSLKFTYTPFAALVFTAATLLPLKLLEYASLGVNTVATLLAVWVTLAAVGWPGSGQPAGQVRSAASSIPRRASLTLLIGAAVFWLEPVQRTLFLGQIELILMALIMWDLCQPDRRLLKGAGVGVAAGIKLVPLIFIPYLLLTRRFRQAAVAAGAFALTAGIGFAADPADSARWWLGGLFAAGSRTGFVGWEGNQSLLGLITRLTGSVAAGQRLWIWAAIAVVALGLVTAMLLDRAGQPVVALLACALTGILLSPISWDHHWVWVVPAVAAAFGYAMRSRGPLRTATAALATVIAAVFFAWPGSLWGKPNDLGGFSLGLIWAPPNTSPGTYYRLGDRPWFAEYHWHGLQLLSGNLYVLTGMGLLVLLSGISVWLTRHRPVTDKHASPTALASSITGAQSVSMS
ncbi:MAG TPA: glycosyltransferase 87 family protein [Streptosporangiaceae bacterium]|nr:glycosyltransferase 87 family protein [Streptosporangiaceae bacterium]